MAHYPECAHCHKQIKPEKEDGAWLAVQFRMVRLSDEDLKPLDKLLGKVRLRWHKVSKFNGLLCLKCADYLIVSAS